MAIFQYDVRPINRAKGAKGAAGRSMPAAAAYRAAEKILDERAQKTHDYSRRHGVLSSELVLPDNAPEMDRQQLWNAAEAAEKRKDAKIGREAIIGLPCELDDAERERLTSRYTRWLVDRHGMAIDASIHAPSREGDERNHHAHLLMTTRTVGPDGMGEKLRELDVIQTSREHIEAWRAAWAEHVNEALELGERARGLEVGTWGRITHRSLREQGLEREPQIKLGHAAMAMERRGERTYLGDQAREVEERNAAREAAREREQQERAERERQAQAEQERQREAEREAKRARELDSYQHTLEQSAERRRAEQEQQHARALARLEQQQRQQREDHQARTTPPPEHGIVSRVADWLMPGRVREREQEQERERLAREQQRRERDERDRREREELTRRHDREQRELRQELEQRRQESLRVFQERQARIEREAEERRQSRELWASQTQTRGYGRERERSRDISYDRSM